MKKILPVAVLAAIHNISVERTVHVNADGTAQVLLFPFYKTSEKVLDNCETYPIYRRENEYE